MFADFFSCAETAKAEDEKTESFEPSAETSVLEVPVEPLSVVVPSRAHVETPAIVDNAIDDEGGMEDNSDDLPLLRNRHGFGVSWGELRGRDVDIDLQCVVIDEKGVIVDCAYYNNLKAAGSITHSGDTMVVKNDGLQELVWVNTRKLPKNVKLLIFVVAAYSGGALKDVADPKFHVLEEKESKEIAAFKISTKGSVDVIGVMYKDHSWKFRLTDTPAQLGQHFMDILPLLSTTVRTFIPSAPEKQKIAFAMEKGGVFDLPREMNSITVGLGWDVDEGEADLDVSAVLMDADGGDLEAVFFGRLESEEHGIQHTGDNLTGEGEGDDEQIVVNLDSIGEKVDQVFFVVNIYTPNKTFSKVANPYCRVVDNSTDTELCRYALKEAGRENGLIIARIARESGGRWGFHALGLPCRGRTYKDSLPKLRETSKVKTASLMLRSQTTADFSDPGGSSHPIVTTNPIMDIHTPSGPPAKSNTPCCVLS